MGRTSFMWLVPAIGLSACATISGDPAAEPQAAPLEQPSAPNPVSNGAPADDAASNGPASPVPAAAQAASSRRRMSNTVAGTGRFLNRPRPGPVSSASSENDTVTLNLVDASIAQAAKTIVGEILDANYVIEDGVQGTITLQTGQPIKKADLVPVLEAVLRAKGIAILEDDGLYRIVPLATAQRSGAALSFARSSDRPGFGVRVEPLRHVAAAEMARILEPIAPQGAVLRVDSARNLLMLAGTRQELASMLETIQIFDVDWLAGMSFGFYPVRSTSPEVLVKELTEVFATEKEGPTAGLIRFIPNERLKAIIAISPRSNMLRYAETWIARLDAGGIANAEQLYVYPVQNGTAEELADVLQGILSAGGEARYARPRTPVAPGREAVKASAEAGTASVQTRPVASDGVQGFEIGADSPIVSGERVTVYPYDSKNALVIVATPQDYRKILSMLEKLDVISNQVLLEATIAEVELRDELNFGLRWFFEEGDHQIEFSSPIGVTDSGFSYVFSRANVNVTLDALASITNVNIVSSPSLMVVDNKTAVLQVGDEVPVPTQSAVISQGVDDDAIVRNAITFRDTGVILRVTPRVNDSGIVTLEIEQEVSDVISTTSSGIDAPTIQQRRIQTTVAVEDGQSLALGGLIEDENSQTSAGVPFVSRIPLLGNLFKNKRTVKGRTELLVLITPRVVRNTGEARRVTDEFRRRLQSLERFEQKLGK